MKLYVLLILCNIGMIILALFVTPLIISPIEKYGKWVYDNVNEESKQKIENIQNNYWFTFYVLPIVFTDFVVLLILYLRRVSLRSNVGGEMRNE